MAVGMSGMVLTTLQVPASATMRARPKPARRTMDVGPATGAYKLLGVYDSAGVLSTNTTDLTAPRGTTSVTVRCVGGGAGGGSTDNGVGPFSGTCGNQRYVYYTGTGGGGFAKTNSAKVSAGTPALAQVTSNAGAAGIGLSVNGVTVGFAQNGTGTSAGVGDVVRGGGGGGSPGNAGAGGDHGCSGVGGSSRDTTYPCNYDGNNFQGSGPEHDTIGGDGGTAGDYGDPDAIGVGWNTVTRARYSGVLASRLVVHFYGFA